MVGINEQHLFALTKAVAGAHDNTVGVLAQDTGRSERTVRRTLAQIRELMAERFGEPDEDPGLQVQRSKQEWQRNEPRRTVSPAVAFIVTAGTS